MALVGVTCFLLAAAVVAVTGLQALRVARARRRDRDWRRRAAARRVGALARKVPCTACDRRLPPADMHQQGRTADDRPLFLCPDCQRLFERNAR